MVLIGWPKLIADWSAHKISQIQTENDAICILGEIKIDKIYFLINSVNSVSTPNISGREKLSPTAARFLKKNSSSILEYLTPFSPSETRDKLIWNIFSNARISLVPVFGDDFRWR